MRLTPDRMQHDQSETRPRHARVDRHLSGPAAARHRRVPPHDRPALRGPREVHPRARGGDEGRQVHPAGHAGERHRRRPGHRRHLHHRHARLRAAAAEAAGRHREGAGRGVAPRQGGQVRPHGRVLRGRRRGAGRRPARQGRGRGPGALGGQRVRELRQAEQEDLARGRGRRRPDLRLPEARRHGRVPPRRQDLRQAGHPRDHLGRPAPGEVPRPDGERDLRAAGREAHPHARQASDGEDAARVLPQRADEGHPEGARRRGRQGRPVRARRPHQGDQAVQGGPRQGAGRAEEAEADVAHVGRGHRGAQLPRLAAVDPVEQALEDQARPAARRVDA